MTWMLIAGGAIFLLYSTAKTGALGAQAAMLAGVASTAVGGAVHGTVKLGNADPGFEPWLAKEAETLLGPVSGAAAFRATDHEQLAAAIRARRLLNYDSQATRPARSLSISSPQGIARITGLGVQGTQLGLSIAGKVTGSVAKAVPIVGSAVELVTSIIGIFTAHHAAAVQKEQATLYSAEPQLNQALDQLDAMYRSGQLGGQQIKNALEELYQNFVTALSQISQPAVFSAAATIAGHHCNAGCTQERALRGIIDAMDQFDY
jgi:hypothetical protein